MKPGDLRLGAFPRICLWLGLIFLYVPLAMLVLGSFNANRLVSVWSGFTLHWYAGLFSNEALLQAAGLSLLVAATSATLAVLAGTQLAFVLARRGVFRGRALLALLGTAPLVIPEVILGLSLLLLFSGMEDFLGWPRGRGLGTLILAHASFTVAFVSVVVQARLAGMDPQLEEAARDLGATPWRSFREVTLPLILPGVVAGWLLAFTLSLDDVVIASFTSGPGGSTLPLLIWSKVRLGLAPEINALATLLMLVVTLCLLLSAWLFNRARSH